MPLNSKETVTVKGGDMSAMARALIAQGARASVVRTITAGDTRALVEYLGLTGPTARAVLSGDVQAIPGAVSGLL